MKNLKKYALAAAIAVVAGFGIYLNQPKKQMSDVILANVDALAEGEVIGLPACAVVINSWCLYFTPWEVWEEPGYTYN